MEIIRVVPCTPINTTHIIVSNSNSLKAITTRIKMCTTITEDPHLREDHQIEIIQHHRHLISCRHLSLKQQPQLLLLQCSNQARPSEYSISIEQYWVWPKKNLISNNVSISRIFHELLLSEFSYVFKNEKK